MTANKDGTAYLEINPDLAGKTESMIKCAVMTRICSLLIAFLAFAGSLSAAPPSDHSPLLVLASGNHFGHFTGEILRTEGFNSFQQDSLADVKITTAWLMKFDVVILAENKLTVAQQQMMRQYVQKGGNLIAFQPDRALSDVFGIRDSEASMEEGYIRIDTVTETGRGLTSRTLHFHGPADMCALNGATQIAALYKNGTSLTGYPAVVENNFERGHAMAFLYNLPQSIAYTRQGNHHYAGQERDGITGIRAMDMFTDGWVDTTTNTINHADEQMRLLTHGIERMNRYVKPLPRFWYFPDTLQCLVTLNNDGEDNKEKDFQPQFADIDGKGVKMTLYVKEVDFISKKWIDNWRGKGFEISGHPDDTKQATNPDWQTMDSVYKALNGKLKSVYDVPSMRTVVNHWFVWCGKDADGSQDFAAQAKIEKQNGIRLDCNYAHYDNHSSQGHFLGALGTNQGNYTGSGLVMRFADEHGRPLNIFQQLNNVYDQQYMENKDPDGYFNCFRGLLDRSLDQEVYSFICVKAHNAEYFFSKIPLMNMMDYAKSRFVPVWTEEELLAFLQARDEARFTHVRWANDVLSFQISSPLKLDHKLACMIPYRFNGKKIKGITVNGTGWPYIIRSVKGFEYALPVVMPGRNYKLAVQYED